MSATVEAKDIQKRMGQIEALVQAVERFSDPAVQGPVRKLLAAVLEFHADGIERIFEGIAESGATGIGLIDELAADEVVNGLLLLHSLHPASLESRIDRALDQARGVLRTHGGNVELLSFNDGVLSVRIVSASSGGGAGGAPLRRAVEEAVFESAPDVRALHIEGGVDEHSSPQPRDGFVPIEAVRVRGAASAI